MINKILHPYSFLCLEFMAYKKEKILAPFLWKKCSPRIFFDKKNILTCQNIQGCCKKLDKICLTNWKWVGLTDWIKSVWITNKDWLMKLTKSDWVTSKVWLRVDGFQTRENLSTFFMKKNVPPRIFLIKNILASQNIQGVVKNWIKSVLLTGNE